ncbi:MAG: hypothetical protein K6E51_14305 [Treponema sp.]|nr:hypothetical protein [Treponema sp.]
MTEKNKKELVSLLEKESTVLDATFTEQSKLRVAVMAKDWMALQDCILSLNELSDSFSKLEEKRTQISVPNDIVAIPEVAAIAMNVRNKLIKSKIENSALADYVRITRGFIQGILDKAVPQKRNTLYSRTGTIVKTQPNSVVLNALM